MTASLSGTWRLGAGSTTQVNMIRQYGGLSPKLQFYISGIPTCTVTLQISTLNGTWSNAAHTLTVGGWSNFNTSGAFCPTQNIAPGVGTVLITGTYTVSNTTNPGTPITVQP